LKRDRIAGQRYFAAIMAAILLVVALALAPQPAHANVHQTAVHLQPGDDGPNVASPAAALVLHEFAIADATLQAKSIAPIEHAPAPASVVDSSRHRPWLTSGRHAGSAVARARARDRGD
jgi:hypothetical protein